MLKNWMANISKGNSVIGMEIILLPDNSFSINLVGIKKEGQELKLEFSQKNITGIEHVFTHIKSKIPVIILLSGKAILSKKIVLSETEDVQSLLNKVLPNVSLNEFKINYSQENDSEAIVSVIRNDALEKVIEELKRNKILNIVELYLSPLSTKETLPIVEKEIQNAFIAASKFFSEKQTGILESVKLNELKEEYHQKKRFQMRGVSMLTGLLILLLINYFIFLNYWTKAKEITTQVRANRNALQECQQLKTEYERKKSFLEQNGLLENSRTSFYADQLAKDLPTSINWKELSVYPLKKKKPDEDEKHLTFENKTIKISGSCDKSIELNEWIKQLKIKKWISNVDLVNYKQENAKEDGYFDLMIKLR